MRAFTFGIAGSVATAAAAVAATSVVVVAAAAAPADSRDAAGVFPPWWSQAEALSAASRAGAVLAVGAAPFIVIVRDPAGRAPARLRAAGALFQLDATGLAGCSPGDS
jgi:hypothetical protein